MWRARPIGGMDTETDSVDVEDARILSACVGIYRPGEGWQSNTWMLKPSRPVPTEASDVNGITTDRAEAEGIDRREGLAAIRAHLLAAWLAGAAIAGHNVRFDLTILDRELTREGFGPLAVQGVVLDTLVICKAADREARIFEKGRRYTLAACCERNGITLTDAHTADADTLAAARLAWKVASAVPFATDPADRIECAHQWQADAYAADRASFARYLAKKGEQLDDTDYSWPIRGHQPPAQAA